MKLTPVHTDPECRCFTCKLTGGAVLGADTAALLLLALDPGRNIPADGDEIVDAYRTAILQSALLAIAIPHTEESSTASQRLEAAIVWMRENLPVIRRRRIRAKQPGVTNEKQ